MKDQILNLIEKNSKISSEDIAKMLGASVAEVEAAICEMEADHIICGYPVLINWDKAEHENVTALIEVKVTPQRGQGFDRIAERIYKYDEVEAVYLMSGGFDLTVVIRGKSMREVATFVSSRLAPMESVLSTATHFVLKKYKEHGISLETEPEEERMLITP